MEIKSEEYREFLSERFLTVQEAAGLLEISAEELWELVHRHTVPTHTIAGAFVRFKQKDIEELKNKWRIERELFPGKQKYFSHVSVVSRPTWMENLSDFWYFNDFYVLCSLLIVVLLYVILSFQ